VELFYHIYVSINSKLNEEFQEKLDILSGEKDNLKQQKNSLINKCDSLERQIEVLDNKNNMCFSKILSIMKLCCYNFDKMKNS
jgi:hypothetical protein